MGLLWRLTGRVSRMQLVTLVLVIVFGGLSVWLNDERFFKMKPTIIYLIFGGILGAGLLRRRSYLQLVMEEAVPLTPAGWMILTRRLTAVFPRAGWLNEAIWRLMSTESWVYFKTFGLSAAIFGFFITQGGCFPNTGWHRSNGQRRPPRRRCRLTGRAEAGRATSERASSALEQHPRALHAHLAEAGNTPRRQQPRSEVGLGQKRAQRAPATRASRPGRRRSAR